MSANPWVQYKKESKTYGKFIAEPLERGYGTTLGNSMRRLLLSSISGAAVTKVKIEGADHEFATIPNVKEDILDILANIKTLAVKSHTDSAKEIKISVKGPAEVTAGDIQHDDEIEIINPKHHIASLSKGAKLEIAMTVEKGTGFIISEHSESKKLTAGTMPIDASFSPIVRVNHKVEPTRVGKSIDYDKLILEVWTNGAITPEAAVQQSAKIIKSQMDLFLKLNEKPEVIDFSAEAEGDSAKGLNLSIDDLELSARSSNCLKKAKIDSVAQLVKMPIEDLLKIKNFGKKSADEINEKLAQYGLSLSGDFSSLGDDSEEE